MYEYNLGYRFQAVAEAHAGRTAIWFDKRDTASYDELNKKSNQMARWLLDQEIKRGDVVCLSGTKTIGSFACILSCLKTGAVYCVVDPESPVERLARIFQTCKPKMLFGESGFLQEFRKAGAAIAVESHELGSRDLQAAIQKYGDGNLSQTRNVTGEDSAYIMFTSGSTGIPKGAVMTHANVLNLIDWSKETYSISSEDVLTNVNPLYFDNSVFDFYSALFTGATLVPFSREEVKDPGFLVEKVDAARCTLWFSVPSLLIFLQSMKATDGKHLRSVRRFVFGGEKYPKAKLKRLYDVYSDTSEFFNVYGPTECTCICSSYRITGDDLRDLEGLPPLGEIANNFTFMILDDQGKKVRQGEVGELCLMGPNVGKGYYNDPDRTALSFVQNPYNSRFRETMYKTGDLVRLNPGDGKLHIQGRMDNQIKHMGYRIELEEIEAAMHRLDYVSEAAALHSELDGISRIVAVVASRKEFEDERIRRDLRKIIPDYMVPSVFYREEMLPKNANGKVDRLRLAERYLQQEA